jgi:hypothetical protein
MSDDVTRKTWQEFRNSGLLWFTNRILHCFGWAIVIDMEADGGVVDIYPARVTYRGFPSLSEERGFTNLHKYLADNITDIRDETIANQVEWENP